MSSPRIRRAILSVSDKAGLVELGRGLTVAGVELFSTGGTRKALEQAGVPVKDVAEYTGFPEMMDGRVKTLHPKIFAGLLWRHDVEEDRHALEQHGILSFELAVVNLYPFEATVAKPETTWAQAVEQVDIGGPSLVRAAAKNHAFTTIVTSPKQYAEVLEAVTADGGASPELRRRLAAEAFAHTARYDQSIADYFAQQVDPQRWPQTLRVTYRRQAELRYGENPHQTAAVYAHDRASGASLVAARQLAGKELSYNNLLDLDSCLAMVRSLREPAAVVVKHNNPCGGATAPRLVDALAEALLGDPVSAFGGVLGLNRPVDAACAELLAEPGRFIECIVAPEFEPQAVEILTTKPKWKNSVRLMAVGDLSQAPDARWLRSIEGGLLAQDADVQADPTEAWEVKTEKKPTRPELESLALGWSLVRHVKSNAIVLAQGTSLVGVGAGQMSRVDSTRIAIEKAGERAKGSVLASDAFFPFPDSIHLAADAGVTAIVQPGGSVKDPDVIAACNERGIAMCLTGKRHFKH